MLCFHLASGSRVLKRLVALDVSGCTDGFTVRGPFDPRASGFPFTLCEAWLTWPRGLTVPRAVGAGALAIGWPASAEASAKLGTLKFLVP